jgi:Xaa-Pro aminopeptidase
LRLHPPETAFQKSCAVAMSVVPPKTAARCQFQSFDEPSSPATVAPRIAALRTRLAALGLAGFVIPRSDQHQGEYVPACDERLAWATGFTGSAGSAVVLATEAALIVDGRYTLQSAAQTDTAIVTPVQMASQSQEAWIEAHLPAGGVLGFDPWVHTPDQVSRLEKAVARAGGSLRAVTPNPVDALWQGRPSPPCGAVTPYPDALAGESAASKLARLREALAKARCDGLVISDPHNLCWLLNIRGSDVPHTPLALGYGIVGREGPVRIIMNPAKLGQAVREALGDLADVLDPVGFVPELERLAPGKTWRLEASSAASAIRDVITAAGGTADVGADPIALMKAAKNATEIAGSRAAHKRDGAAVTRFLSWFASAAPAGDLTEIDAAVELERFRRETNVLREISFGSIAGAGPNAALPHYRVTHASNRVIEPGIFLIDSGGQYEDGTTDITRTLAVREVTPEMRLHYTLVLKGHVAISRAVFPKGTSGAQIDALARVPLWQAGLDFDHGTGHGVGAYLSVHEGPQRISKLGHTTLEAGMILSNEPGYYREGHYGIRIENLIVVEPRSIAGGDREMLGFETVTLAPYERGLIDPALLDSGERAWIDTYHARVLTEIGPLLPEADRAWLAAACAPL